MTLEDIADTIVRGELDEAGWKRAGVKPYTVRYGRKSLKGDPDIPGSIITRPTHLWSNGTLVVLSPPKPSKEPDPALTPPEDGEAVLRALMG